MTKVKVLHLTYDMRIGGTESVIKSLVEGLDTSVFEAEVLCIEPHLGPFGEQLISKGVSVTNLNWVGGFNFNLIKEIRNHLTRQKVDILHCHQYTPWFYGVIASLGLKTKVIFTEHGRFYPDRSSWKRKYINPILIRMTDHITAISKATKVALSDYEFIPQRYVEVIYNGIRGLEPQQVNPELRQSVGITEDEIVFGTVARLVPIKNHRMMIMAFASIKNDLPNSKLVIVGDGELKDELTILASELGVQHRIVFTGYQPEPSQFINLIDIFLLSSFSEGTSMTLLEAMSLSKVCVVTDAGGNAEVISHNENGIVTVNDDVVGFANAMLKLGSNQELAVNMGKLGKVRFEKLFSQSKMVAQYHNLYDKSLRK